MYEKNKETWKYFKNKHNSQRLNKISQKNCKKNLEKLWTKYNNGNNLSIQVNDQNSCNKIKKAKEWSCNKGKC